MEGVGARLGRSSTRYGPATVFSGPVRKWKKKWVHVSPLSNTSSSSGNHNHHHHHQSTAKNDNVNGSHLLLYKWTPLTPSQNGSNGDGKISVNDDATAAEEPPRRKFKYIPIALLDEQTNEAAEHIEDEAKPIETDTDPADPTSRTDDFDEKPDINDVPMEENQASEDSPLPRQDLNESLDLSLGLKAHDEDNKIDQTKGGQLEKVNSSGVGT